MSARPTREAVRQRFVELLNEVAGIDPSFAKDEATVDNQLQMKSVEFVELQVAIEDEYEIQVDPVQIVELNQLGAIVEYIYQAIEAAR